MKVSSCCGAEWYWADMGGGEIAKACCVCGRLCQLVDKPEIMICPKDGTCDCDHKAPHKRDSNCVEMLPACGCPGCVPYTEPVVDKPVEPDHIVSVNKMVEAKPTAQSSPNLDELMPLVDFIDDEVIAKCWLAPLYDGAKKQLVADKAITARLLAEKDTRIVGLESRIEGYRQYIKELVAEKDQTIKRVQGDYDLLADEHRVYRDKIKELEAELAKLKAPFRDEVSGAWVPGKASGESDGKRNNP